MRLRVLAPTEVVLDQEVIHVTAEDVTGSLGIRPGHAPLVTPLAPGIVVARSPDGRERYVAVNGGVMLVSGDEVQIVSRHAVASHDMAHLEATALAEFDRQAQEDQHNRVAFERLRIHFMRRVLEMDRAGENL